MTRPAAAPGLFDAVRASVPPRLVKKLDGVANPAEAWSWAEADGQWRVTTDGGETVTVSGPGPVGPAALVCTCLLSPKCLHVLAVAAALAPPADAAAPAPPAAEPPAAAPVWRSPDGAQRAAARAGLLAGQRVIRAGAHGTGAAALDDLHRAVHAGRAVGLHRLARAGRRVATHVEALQRQAPEFDLGRLADDLHELLYVARGLGADRAPDVLFGEARAAPAPVGALRLHGLCTEPVVAATGHAGVATWFLDPGGRLFRLADVRPGPPSRARAAYAAAVGLGGSTLSHSEASRAGLFLPNATATADGRLGASASIQAARAGASPWEQAPIDAWFRGPPSGGDRVGLVGAVIGTSGHGLWFAVDGREAPAHLTPATEHPDLLVRDNLLLLARAPGLRLRVVVARDGGRLSPLAVGPDPDAPAGLTLPEAWLGRCNLAFDRLLTGHVPTTVPRPWFVEPPAPPPDPVEPLRRRVARMVAGGAETLPGASRGWVEREAADLRAAMMPSLAAALIALADAAAVARREPPERLADAWLRAATAAAAATRRLGDDR